MADDQNAATGLATRVSAWAARPFKQEMDLTGWFLLTLFLTTVVVMWLMVLHNLQDVLEG